jgi:hypothetical protein
MWTAEKELKLLELISERLQIEASNKPELLQKFGYKKPADLVTMKMVALIPEASRQILLNDLIDTKINVVNLDVADQSNNVVSLSETKTDLQNLKEV